MPPTAANVLVKHACALSVVPNAKMASMAYLNKTTLGVLAASVMWVAQLAVHSVQPATKTVASVSARSMWKDENAIKLKRAIASLACFSIN